MDGVAVGPSLVLRCCQAPAFRLHVSEAISLLGRSPYCDFIVDDLSISRKHAELRLLPGGLEIADLASANGTFFQGQQIQTRQFEVGEVVQFGNIHFVLGKPKNNEEAQTLRGNTAQSRLLVPADILSAGQLRVFHPLMEGLSAKEIAKRLSISKETVNNHTQAIYKAFGVHSRMQLFLGMSENPSQPDA